MYLKRQAEQLLKDMLASGKVGIILGARQVGKTTLVEHVLAGQDTTFLNFDVEVDKARFRAAACKWHGRPWNGICICWNKPSSFSGCRRSAPIPAWSPRRLAARAFRDAYGVEVEPIYSDNPFAADTL